MIPGHPHTVGTSPIPLYMRGWPPVHLGQDIDDPSGDLIDPSTTNASNLLPGYNPGYIPDSLLQQTTYDPTTALEAPSSVSLISTPQEVAAQQAAAQQMYASAVAAGTMTPAQAASAVAQFTSGAVALANAAAGVSAAPSPRVALPVATAPNPLTAATVIPGVPNYILLAAAAIAAVAMGSK
jgi:hypothetical protein